MATRPGRRIGGPPPLPTERKRALGNPGHQKLPKGNLIALAPASHVFPEPEDGTTTVLAADGGALVRALLESAASAWIAVPDRLTTLELVRTAWDRRLALLADIEQNGTTYYGGTEKYGDRWFRRPEVIELESLEKRITVWLSQLGLNPADRSRLGVAEVKARSRLEQMQDRRDRKVRAG